MAKLDKLLESMFCEVSDVVIDVQSGAVGVKVKNMDGEVVRTLVKEGDKFTLSSNPITELAFDIPAYAVRTAPADLKEGDIVLLEDNSWGFYVGAGDEEGIGNPVIRVVNAKTGRTTPVSVAHNRLFGTYGILAVKNLFGGAAAGGNGGFESILPLLLLKDGGLDDSKGLLLMLMLSGGKLGGEGGLGNILPLLLLKGKDGGKMDDLLMLSLLGGGGFGGGAGGGMLPFLAFAGNKEKAAKPAAAVPRPAAKRAG